MQQGLLPLFPLPLVMFPRTALPLHIFEDRYKELGRRRASRPFGIRRRPGQPGECCRRRLQRGRRAVLERYPDGRLDILTTGLRRFELLSLDEGKSYLRASIDFFDDEPGAELPPPASASAPLDAYQALA